MAQTYVYKARNNSGQIISGQMEAEAEKMVVMRLREQGSMVISLEKREVAAKSISIQFKKKVSLKDIAIFSRQFATMLNAGLPIINSLTILQQQSENKELQEILTNITEKIETGTTISQAFGEYPHIFPVLFVSLLQVGETTGTIDSILNRLADYYEKEYELKEKISSAMIYPSVVLFVAFGVVIFLMTFILPMFEGIFQEMDIELPMITKVLLGASHFITGYWYIIAGSIALGIYGIHTYLKTDDGKLFVDKWKTKAPVFGNLSLKVSVSRFSLSLAIMTSCGIPVLQAIEIARDTLNNRILANDIDQMQLFVKNGGNMSSYLENSKKFPSMMSKMIAVGESTGSLDSMLHKIAEFYDKEVQFVISRLTTALEPFIITFLGLVVGGIVISIMLPMFSMMDGIGGH